MLGSDLSLERAAAVLEESPLGLAPAWRELEEAQIFRGAAFSHDLLYETTLATTPEAIQAYLHRRAAAVLEQAARESASGVSAVRVAQHWLAAGETLRAAPWLWEAAQAAQAAYRLREAADLYRQAAWGFEARHERPEAFRALERSLGLQLRFDLGAQPQADLERLLSLAEAPAEYALARRIQAGLLQNRGDGAGAEAAARQTAYHYELHGLAVGAATRAAQALLRLGQPAAALARAQEAVGLLEAYDPTDFYRGEVLWTHHAALVANHHPTAPTALQEALGWVHAASQQVPEAYRESFLYLNPVNGSLLEAAGLPIGESR